jgi:uncharacterized protein YndB with AHSA1/START domain
VRIDPGALAVRRSVQITATPERVWREFESFERMRRWWTGTDPRTGMSQSLEAYEPRIDGTFTLAGDGGERFTCDGRVVVHDPPRELTCEWTWESRHRGWKTTTLLTITLTPNDYGTLVELVHHGFERNAERAVEEFLGFEGGWRNDELQALRRIVEEA